MRRIHGHVATSAVCVYRKRESESLLYLESLVSLDIPWPVWFSFQWNTLFTFSHKRPPSRTPVWISSQSNTVFRICSKRPSSFSDHLHNFLFEPVLSQALYVESLVSDRLYEIPFDSVPSWTYFWVIFACNSCWTSTGSMGRILYFILHYSPL